MKTKGKMEKIIRNKKGITLIALVVTIVVLLILAGISLNLVIGNNGVITKAKEAKIETRAGSVEDERNLWMNDRYLSTYTGDTPKTMEEILTELETKGMLTSEEVEIIKNDENNEITIGSKNISFKLPVIEQIKIGDYVNYSYDSLEEGYLLEAKYSGNSSDQTIEQPEIDLEWRVLSINEDGSVDLVSATPTDTWVYFRGAVGYNNGVYLLHDLCEKLFSNSSLGITARSINIKDIEAQETEAGTIAKKSYSNSYATYGDVKTYEGNYSYYPNLYAYQKGSGVNSDTGRTDGISESDKDTPELLIPTTESYTKASDEKLTVTQTYYKNTLDSTNYGVAGDILNSGEGNLYWVASRSSSFDSPNQYFGLIEAHTVLHCTQLFYSWDNIYASSGYLRPIVSLNADSVNKLTKDLYDVWQINN